MSKWKLRDWTGNERMFAPEQTRNVLEALKSLVGERREIVRLEEIGTEKFISVGISRDVCFVNFHRNLDPPYYSSVGDQSRPGDDLVCFNCEGTRTEISRRNCIDFGAMTIVVTKLLARGDLPIDIEWDKD